MRPAIAELLMSLATLQQELQGLELEMAHEIERNMLEGKCYHGRTAAVQTLGRKGL